MEPKKISFGFSKINKKLNLLQAKETIKTEPKVELVKCLEGQEIKLVEDKPKETPLVIQLKEIQKTSAALASLMKRRAILLGKEEPEDDKLKSTNPPVSLSNVNSEDIENRAVRELLADIEKNGSSGATNNLVLPVVKPDDLPLDGAKESTLDDYESIPIQDFGKAMLRGMGWTESVSKANKKGGSISDDTPVARPKGMGLGADKALKKKTLLVTPEPNEALEIKRNAYVLILGGKHKDLYGRIEGFDDHAGRVIVKMAIGGNKEVFNEFLCQPVSRKEYAQYGKCINSSKYEAYKKKENEFGQIILDKSDKCFNETDKINIKKERNHCVEDRYQKNNDAYENDYNYDCKEEKKDIKKLADNIMDKKTDRSHDYGKNDVGSNIKSEDGEHGKGTNSNEYRCNKGESRKDDIRDHDKNYKNENRQREQDVYHSKSDYTSSLKSRRDEIYDNKSHYSRDCNRFYSREKNREHESDRDAYPECSHYKTIDLDSPSDSESRTYPSKYKKPKKGHSKKSKKSKKNKSKYKSDSSDSSSSDSEEEKRKKHKKKTKKSKKQRERSRSRGR